MNPVILKLKLKRAVAVAEVLRRQHELQVSKLNEELYKREMYALECISNNLDNEIVRLSEYDEISDTLKGL